MNKKLRLIGLILLLATISFAASYAGNYWSAVNTIKYCPQCELSNKINGCAVNVPVPSVEPVEWVVYDVSDTPVFTGTQTQANEYLVIYCE